GEVIVGAEIHAAAKVILLAFGRKKNKGNQGQFGIRLQRAQYAVPIQLRHHDVAQDQIGLLSARHFQPQASVFSPDGLVLFIAKESGDVAPHLGFVLDDQDPFHNFVSKTGSLTVTVVPSPSLLTNWMFPPWSSTQRFTTSRPSPVPGRLPTLPPRWKAL